MSQTRASLLSTTAVDKSQIYALLVDSSGAPILDLEGYEQVVDLQVVGGRLKVDASITGSLANVIILLNTVTVATVGTYVLQGEKTITIEIYGTSTSRNINFQGKGESGTVRTLMGVKLSDLSLATSTTGTGELWQFDVTGLVSFITDLTVVAGGNVIVKGRAVA